MAGMSELEQEVRALKWKLEEQKGELEEKKEELDSSKLKIVKQDQMLQQVKDKSELEQEMRALKQKMEEQKGELDSSKRKIVKQDLMLQQLKDKLECPVCLDIPRSGPVPVCPNGHFVCKNCKAESCPTCRTAMGEGRSFLAVTILENIEHKCRFDDCAKNFPLEDIEKHEAVCQNRPVLCPHVDCTKTVALSKLLDHFMKSQTCCAQDKCPLVTLKTWNRRNYTLAGCGVQANNISFQMHVYMFFGEVFAMFPIKCEGHFYFVMVMFASEIECSKYKFEMIAHERGSEALDSEVAVRYQGSPLSIDLKKKDLNVFVTSEPFMDKILKRSDSKTDFSLSFTMSKK